MKINNIISIMAVAYMFSIGILIAMDPEESNLNEPQNRLFYSEHYFQKFMLLQEIANMHEQEHRDYIPKDVIYEISKIHVGIEETYKKAEEVVTRVKISGVYNATFNPKDAPTNLALDIFCKKHPEVIQLTLDDCTKITDLAPLQNLKKLYDLSMANCKGIRNLSPLQKMETLQYIKIDNCIEITDLTPFQNLNLCMLSMANCIKITDLTPVQRLQKIYYLNLANCAAITDLTPLQRLTELSTLSMVGCTGITDLSPLQALTLLRYLHLKNCIGITDLTPLMNAASLNGIDMTNCVKISESQIEALKTALPNCATIIY